MLLLKNGIILTMDAQGTVWEDGALAIFGGRIEAVGSAEALEARYTCADVLDCKGKLILPGFVNAHTHLFQTPLRGFADDLPLTAWLNKGVYPFCAHMDAQAFYDASRLSIVEMLRSGITTFVESHYIHRDKASCDAIIKAVEETGLRAVISRAGFDQPPAPESFRETIDTAVKECVRVIEAYHGYADGRVSIRVEPMNELSASHKFIRAMHELSAHYGVGMCMHIVEVKERLEQFLQTQGCSPIGMLDALGVLGPHLLLAHCIWTTQQDRVRLAQTDTRVAHNVVANQYLGDGAAPIVDYRNRGIQVALGTDGAAGNNTLDMFAVMKAACLLQKVTHLDPTVMSAKKALEMATIGGARALNMEKDIGSLEAGKYADLICIDLDTPQMVPRRNYISNLVYAASPAVVDTVMVRGEILFQDKAFVSLDEQTIIEKADRLAEGLYQKVLDAM